MPQDKQVDAAAEVAKSKKLLARAEKAFPSSDAKKAGAVPVPGLKPKTTVVPKPEKPSALGSVIDQMGSTAQGLKARGDMMKGSGIEPMPLSMHEGGEVTEDGLKNLQKGEVVIPKEKAEEGKKIMALKGKAGAMSEAIEEEKEEKAEKETPAEEKKEGKKGEAKEEKAEPKEEKAEGKKKISHAHTILIHNHKKGHSMHSLHEDGSNQVHQFALGDHAAMASKMAELTGGEPGEEMGGEPQGEPQGQ